MKTKEFISIVKQSASIDVPYSTEFVQKMQEYELEPIVQSTNFNLVFRRISISLVTMFVLIVSLVTSISYQTVTASFTVDINPSVEVDLNTYNKVIGLRAINTDGEALIDEMTKTKGSIESVLDSMMETSSALGFLNQDNDYILIGVQSDSYTTESSLSSDISTILDIYSSNLILLNAHTYSSNLLYSGLVVSSSTNSSSEDYIFTDENESGSYNQSDGVSAIVDATTDSFETKVYIAESYFTTYATQNNLSDAKLQLVLTIYNYYTEYQTNEGFNQLINMDLKDLYNLYIGIVE